MKTIYRILGSIFALTALACMIYKLTLVNEPIYKLAAPQACVNSVVLILFLLYYILGGSKKQRNFYRSAMAFYAIKCCVSIFLFGYLGSTPGFLGGLDILGDALIITSISHLLFSKDLGKKLSYLCACITLIDPIVSAIYLYKMLRTVENVNELINPIATFFGLLVISLTLITAVAVKYSDKAERYAMKDVL